MEQPGHSLRLHITRNLKELKEIIANSKAFSLRRTLGSLALLAKPSHTFRTSGTDECRCSLLLAGRTWEGNRGLPVVLSSLARGGGE